MPYIDVGESRLYYEAYGEGPPLVLAHGVGGNHASWFRQVPEFARNYRVVVFDHRAFGNSTDIEQLGRARFIADLEALLDGLGIARAVLVGQSMGGGTVAAFTIAHPERVAGVVVASSLAGCVPPEPIASELRAVEAATADLSQVERVLGPVLREDDPALTLLYLQIASFNSVTIKTVRGAMPRWSPRELAAGGVPVQFLAGEHDVLFPPELVCAVHGLVPGSRYHMIEGAGHSAYFERATAFNTRLAAFLEELPGWQVR
jgi:pimeloyl-ACP methyl ester carboxylesterase